MCGCGSGGRRLWVGPWGLVAELGGGAGDQQGVGREC